MSLPEETKPITGIARRFIERQFSQFRKEATKGTGLYYELYAQKFTDSVDRLISLTKRTDLREHIRAEARNTDDYVRPETGHWTYSHQFEDVQFNRADATSERSSERAGTEALLQKATTPSEHKQRRSLSNVRHIDR